MKISICNKCKGFNYKKIITELKKDYPLATYDTGCNNMCGIGRSKCVVIINDKPIIADNEAEV